jgi:transposase
MWDRYSRGATLAAVGEEFGVGPQRVSKLLHKYGFPMERATRRPQDAARARTMHALYEQGLTLDEVGERYDLTGSRVSQIFRRYEFPLRVDKTQTEAWRRRREKGLARAQEMHKVHMEGLSLEQVGHRFGVSGAAVREALMRAGLPRRKPGGLRSTSFGQPRGWQRSTASG